MTAADAAAEMTTTAHHHHHHHHHTHHHHHFNHINQPASPNILNETSLNTINATTNSKTNDTSSSSTKLKSSILLIPNSSNNKHKTTTESSATNETSNTENNKTLNNNDINRQMNEHHKANLNQPSDTSNKDENMNKMECDMTSQPEKSSSAAFVSNTTQTNAVQQNLNQQSSSNESNTVFNNANNTTNNNNTKKNADKHAQFKLDKEIEEFNKRLIEFHKHKNINTPMISWPTFNGKPVDLHKLYNKVISLGGWERVCEKEKWNEVVQHLDAKLFGSCANGEHALKLIYMRYLSVYEKVHLSLSTTTTSTTYSSNTTPLSILLDNMPSSILSNPYGLNTTNSSTFNAGSFSSLSGLGGYKGSISSLKDDDKDEESLIIGKKRFTYLMDSIPMNYNYSQHVSSNLSGLTPINASSGGVVIAPGVLQSIASSSSSLNLLGASGLSQQQLVTPSLQFNFNPYEKLEISLKSGLSNEVDFAFNTILLLSSDEQHAFKIYSSSQLVDLMLAHVGFFGINDKYNFRHLYDNVWHSVSDSDECKNYLEESVEDYIHDRMTNNLKKKPRRNYVKFWHEMVKLPDEAIVCDFDYKDSIKELMPKLYNTYLNTLPSQDVLSLREMKKDTNDNNETNLNDECVEFRRIEQVMVTLNNLSFEENNAEYMANKCPSLFEFLIMCLYCTNGSKGVEIRKHALDILANLTRKIKLRTLNEKHRCLFLMSIIHLIIGQQQQQQETNDSTYITTISNEDRLEIIRGLEILTKLCSQEVDLDDDDSSNERILSRYLLDKKENYFYLDNILLRLEQLLAIQDILILMHCLECLYSMSLYSESICNFIVNYKSSSLGQPKLVSILVNLLTIDMTHFGMQNIVKPASKIYKVMPSNAPLTVNPQVGVPGSHMVQQASPVQLQQNKSHSLLQQTLNNQHNSGMTSKNLLTTNQQMTTNNSNAIKNISHEQQAKNILCNWLVTCFQQDSSSELSKTQLYPYYQQIAKMNNWSVLTIPVFFEILNATFPNLKYEEQSNKIIGLKLVLNVKQQIQLKNQIFNQGQMCKNVPLSVSTINTNPMPTPPLTNGNDTNIQTATTGPITTNIPLSPPPTVSINITVPSIPLLTPPTPPVSNLQINSPQPSTTSGVLTSNQNQTISTNQSINKTQQEANSESEDNLVDKVKVNGTFNTSLDKHKLNGAENSDSVIEGIENRIELNKQQQIAETKKEGHYQMNGNCNTDEINKLNNHLNQNGHLNEQSKTTTSTEHKQNESNSIVQANLDENSSSSSMSSTSSSTSTTQSSTESKSNENAETVELNKRKIEDINSLNQLNQNEPDKTQANASQTPNTNSKRIKLDENNESAQNNNNVNSNTPVFLQQAETQLQHQQIAQATPTPSQTAKTQAYPVTNVPTQASHSQTSAIENALNSNSNIPQTNQVYLSNTNNDGNVEQNVGDYMCEWNNCKRMFPTAKAVYNHVCKYHLLNSNIDNNGTLCMWSYCDQIKRQKWSIVNHIQERHCNENALKAALVCRQRGLIPAANNSTLSNSVLNYSKDAAFLAIQRNQRLRKEDFLSCEEGPITKSLRLLAALILRNLARNSDSAKNSIKPYESVLTNVAFDLLESSNAVANCLWHLSH